MQAATRRYRAPTHAIEEPRPMMGTWIEILLGLGVLVVAWLGMRTLSDLRGQLEAMRHAVENINRMVEAQNAENKATLQAINKSVDNTAGYLSRMETAMQAWLRKLGV
jgi:hypothetical protein